MVGTVNITPKCTDKGRCNYSKNKAQPFNTIGFNKKIYVSIVHDRVCCDTNYKSPDGTQKHNFACTYTKSHSARLGISKRTM